MKGIFTEEKLNKIYRILDELELLIYNKNVGDHLTIANCKKIWSRLVQIEAQVNFYQNRISNFEKV